MDGRSVICKNFVGTRVRHHKARHCSTPQEGKIGGKRNSKKTNMYLLKINGYR